MCVKVDSNFRECTLCGLEDGCRLPLYMWHSLDGLSLPYTTAWPVYLVPAAVLIINQISEWNSFEQAGKSYVMPYTCASAMQLHVTQN